MAFPTNLTNAVDGVTDVMADHLNNLEAKLGIDGSLVTSSLDYLLRNPGSVDPGHVHSSYQVAGSYITALTGDVAASGPGSAGALIQAGAVNLSKMANLAANSIIGNNTASPATPLALSVSQVKSLLALTQADVAGLTTTSSPTFTGLTLAVGSLPTITTSGISLKLKQTGDALGATSLTIQNRTGSAGAVFANEALDLVDFGFKPSVGAQQNLRLEHRSGSLVNPLNTAGEFQLSDGTTVGIWFSTGANGTVIKSGSVGIGTSPNAAALLHMTSTTKGFLPPVMTTVQKAAISSPPEGLLVYDATLHKLCVYTGTAWETITSA